MMSCKKVIEKSSDYVDGQLPLITRMGMRMHLLMCVHCRRYVRQILSTSQVIKLLGKKQQQCIDPSKIDRTVAAMAEAKNPEEHQDKPG